jgi:sec-independent protein translocase protein TatA
LCATRNAGEDYSISHLHEKSCQTCSGVEEFMFEGLMQPMHLLVILFIALLFFGPSKLGDLGKGLGDGIRHFKNAMREGSEPTPAAPAATAEKPQEQK